MSYLSRIEDIQTSYSEFKSFLNFYLTTRLNKGFNDVDQAFTAVGLLDLNEFVKDDSWLDASTGTNFPSFFDFPMYVKSYGPDGKIGYGVTPDIGFTRNVKTNLIWKEYELVGNRQWNSMVYSNGKYVALINNDTNQYGYSTDGINWSIGTLPVFQFWNDICYGDGKFICVGENNDTNNVYAYSTDGISWTKGTMPSSQQWQAVCYGDGKFVATSTRICAYSTDGITWAQSTLPSGSYINRLCYGNGKFVGVSILANDMDVATYSTDGITWAQSTLPVSKRWDSICYGAGKFVTIGGTDDDVYAYSTDAITWTQGTMPSKQYWNSVCYGDGKFVAISEKVAYSTDGINWTEGTLPNTGNGFEVCYGDGKFVAISEEASLCSDYVYCYPTTTLINDITVGYATTSTGLLSNLEISVNKPENYYFQVNNGTSNPLFTVPFPSSSNVKYLRNNYSRLFPVSIANVKNLFVFASYYRSSSYGGLVLYVSPDLIHWNVHQLIPGTATSTEVNTLIGTRFTSLSLSSSDATIMQNALRKYVGFLPNGQYVVMYPYEMYKQSGDNMQNMAVLYSPYQNEPLMTINDPYGDEDWENKAINGISAIVDNYGCFDIYYNNRLNCPLSLGISEVINIDLVSDGENTGIPVIVKTKNNYTTGETLYQWNLEASTAPGTHDGTGVAGGTKDINTPLLATAICTLDKDSEMLEDMPLNVRLCSVIGDYGSGQYKSITLLTKEATPYAGNTDEDMSNYITEFYNPSNLDYGTNFGISFKDKNFFVYIPTTDEISKKKTIARITAIGDTASNYSQNKGISIIG